MCGIAGIIGRIAEPQRAALRRMNAALAHRGPDGEGFWAAEPDARGWGALLAHRRLSILDLSNAAAQPMVDAKNGHVVVLNGEIYNYVELRQRLAAASESFQSSGDTAVMLRVLSLGGAEAIASLRGMFAFAHWHPGQRQLTLARDALGIKPLYLARNPDPEGEWSIAFASEVRALLASGLIASPRLNPQAVASLVWNGFVVAPDTAVQGVESLWPGEFVQFDGQGREQRRAAHWQMPRGDNAASISEPELAEVLRETVRLHLASDVPLAVFLSGGVDSSAVAHLARQAANASVQTFTLAFEEAAYNEGEHARRIAAAIGTEHRQLVLTEQHFLDHLERALDSLDQPSFDGLNTYYMSRAVRDAGFKVALVGSGGDELFGGYTTFRDLPALMRWSRRCAWLPESLRVGAARLAAAALQPASGSGFAPQTRWAKLPDMVRAGDDVLALYQLAYALFLPASQRQLLSPEVRAAGPTADGLPAAMRSRLQGELRSDNPLAAISGLEQRLFLGERLLRDSDATSMAASIEMRLPLVDQTLLEAVNRVAPATRYQPIRSKALLRRIGLAGLDPALFDRPKSGFELPFDRWLRNRLGQRIDATLRDSDALRAVGLNAAAVQSLWQAFRSGAPGLYWSRIWALFVFVRWCQRHGLRL